MKNNINISATTPEKINAIFSSFFNGSSSIISSTLYFFAFFTVIFSVINAINSDSKIVHTIPKTIFPFIGTLYVSSIKCADNDEILYKL